MRRAICAAAVLAALLVGTIARAQGTESASPPSPYEASKIAHALKVLHAELDPDPTGKIVEDIDIVPLEVIEAGDPAPSILNILHSTTRKTVLRKEVLLEPGEPYRQYRIDETVRSLQIFQQLSLVLAFATKGKDDVHVRVVLVTKDVWSLRASFDMRLGAGGLDLLRFEPTERNIGGTLVSAVTRFELYPKTITLGGAYFVPRLASERLYLISEGNVVINRDSGHAEGSYGQVGISSPQLSADTPFLWGVGTSWSDVYSRRYVGGQLATFDAKSTREDDHIPDVFHTRAITTSGSVVRSFGVAHKIDVMLGAELNVRQYTGLDPSRYPESVVRDYDAARVPTSDSRAAPFAQIRTYESRFLRLHDVDALGLQEDYRAGYDLSARAYPVLHAIGSSRSFLGVEAIASYLLPLGSGYASATGELTTEVASGVPQVSLAGDVSLVTPTLGFGRLVIDGLGVVRPHNYLNQRSVVGGDGRLRGYPSMAFLGENLVAYNMELRSRPVEILSCQLGTALFFDVGDAFDNGARLQPKSSAGFGVRALFPQLDRKVFRFDVAFPLVRGGGEGPIGFYLAFSQAFGSGAVAPPGAAPAQAILNPLGGALGQ